MIKYRVTGSRAGMSAVSKDFSLSLLLLSFILLWGLPFNNLGRNQEDRAICWVTSRQKLDYVLYISSCNPLVNHVKKKKCGGRFYRLLNKNLEKLSNFSKRLMNNRARNITEIYLIQKSMLFPTSDSMISLGISSHPWLEWIKESPQNNA